MDARMAKELFDSEAFEEQFHCEAPLGALCAPNGTAFHLWAPTAQRVVLRLFRKGEGGAPFERIALCRGERGLWSHQTQKNLDGVYYDYRVTVDGETRTSADPYARACARNGKRSRVIDLSRTDPQGWAEDKAPPLPPQTVIWEAHVKEFSWDPASGVSPENRGKYRAFCEENTTLNGDGEHSTCVAYLKRMGVTHVQLMPVFDYGSVDEGGDERQFNWGYDPVNYNVPEGSYASDASDGAVRIRELKEAIQSLHKNGLRVVMDVVYNHTYRLDSWLWRTVPGYFYRQRKDGSPSNGSGCGNEIASERSMCARYILDSVLYWAQEYHIDGFRFDLMGLMDAPLLNRIRRELDRRYGRGEKLMLGEPWAGGESAARAGTALGDKRHFDMLDEGIAAFCDATRDAVKGSVMRPDSAGFVNGAGLDAGWLACCVRGWAGCGEDFRVRAPSQTVSYLSCHDDWTLWDKLVYTGDAKRRFSLRQPGLVRQNKLAAAMCFGCQGLLFLLSGEEFGRTKRGIRNSYRSSPQINRLDWKRAWKNAELVDYYRGLIALRMRLPGLADQSQDAARRLLEVAQPLEDCAAILLDNTGGDSAWRRLLMAYSAREDAVGLSLPEGEWEILVDANSSFGWQHPRTAEGSIALEPLSALILGQH